MKILYCIDNMEIGGAQKIVEQIALGTSREEGAEVDILILTKADYAFEASLKNSGVRTIFGNNDNAKNPASPYNLKSLYSTWKVIKGGKYDIVHAHLFPALLWVVLANFAVVGKKPKLIATEHNTQNRRRGKKVLRGIDRWMYRRFDLIVSVSDSTRENLLDWLDPPPNQREKFIVIENGVDLDRFQNAQPYTREELKIPLEKDTKLLCMASRFAEAKDQETLIRSMRHLPDNVLLLLAGDGPFKERCMRIAEKEGVSQRVLFLGLRNDIERLIKTIDIAIVSSHWEGFCLAAIEAMAAGKPVVASNVKGLSEVVENAGLLFEEGDSRELALLTGRLLDDPHFYNEISAKCRKRSEKYSLAKMEQLHIACYESLINNSVSMK